MKKTLVLLASLMVMVCMICSCGGSGSGSADEKSVAVSFGVSINDDVQKVIKVTPQTLDNATFWYKATPQWGGSDFTTIQGAQSTWKKLDGFTYAAPTGTVGLFAQGSWKFEVQVTLGSTADQDILYQTPAIDKITPVYVNPNSENFDITVEKVIDSTKKGNVVINITTPLAAAADKLEVVYCSVGSAAAGTTLATSEGASPTLTRSEASGIATFKSSDTGLEIAPGFYVFETTYSVKNSSGGYDVTRSQAVAVEIVAGGTATLAGTLETGVWKSTNFTIKGIKSITATVAAQENPVYKAGTGVTFTCTATTAGFDSTPTITYEWRVKGAKQSATTNTFTYTPSAAGYDEVTCIAYVVESDKVVVSASNILKFTVAEADPVTP